MSDYNIYYVYYPKSFQTKKHSRSPLKLGGAEARMQWGGASKNIGKVIQNIGSRYVLNELNYAGGMMMATGEAQQAIAKEKKAGAVLLRIQN